MKAYLMRAGWPAFLLVAMSLTACSGGPATQPARDHAASGDVRTATATYGAGSSADRGGGAALDAADPRKAPVPLVHGKPMWAANRKHTAQENAEYQFERDGADFGAHSVDEFVSKAHAFVDKPPTDVLTLTRSNGDRLLYDAHGNVFAVVTRDGAPRTMFKPRDGAAYWDEQKAREAARADRASASDGSADGQGDGRRYSRRSSRSSGADDQG